MGRAGGKGKRSRRGSEKRREGKGMGGENETLNDLLK